MNTVPWRKVGCSSGNAKAKIKISVEIWGGSHCYRWFKSLVIATAVCWWGWWWWLSCCLVFSHPSNLVFPITLTTCSLLHAKWNLQITMHTSKTIYTYGKGNMVLCSDWRGHQVLIYNCPCIFFKNFFMGKNTFKYVPSRVTLITNK